MDNINVTGLSQCQSEQVEIKPWKVHVSVKSKNF